MKISVDKILPNPDQPRKNFDLAELQQLAESIQAYGLINPVSVEETVDGMYILIDGERRWRACNLAGLSEIEAHVRPSSNGTNPEERLALALTANLQRSNLTPVEEAQAFKKMADLGMTNEKIARISGCSLATFYNRLLLLELDPDTRALFERRLITNEHTIIKAILSLPTEIRFKVALGFAQRNTSKIFILSTCKRHASPSSMPPDLPPETATLHGHPSPPLILPADLPPAFTTAAHSKHIPSAKHYNALAEANVVPPWTAVREAAIQECAQCDLYDQASGKICRGCPLPGFLVRLLKSL